MTTDDDMHASHRPKLADVDLGCPICGETWLEMSTPSTYCITGYATCTAGHRMPTSIWRRENRLRNDKRPGNTSVKRETVSRDLGLPENEGFTGNPKQAPSPPLLAEGVYPFDDEIVAGVAKPTTDRWTASLLFRYQAELLVTVLRGRIAPSTPRQRELNAWRATSKRHGLLRRMTKLPNFILLAELDEAKRIRRERIARDCVNAIVHEAARQAGAWTRGLPMTPPEAQGAARTPDRLPHTRDWLKPHHGQAERVERRVEIESVRATIKDTTERIGRLHRLADTMEPDIWDALAQHYRDKAARAAAVDVKAQVDADIASVEPLSFPNAFVMDNKVRLFSGVDEAAAAMRTERDAQHAAAEYGGLAPGCCSASTPCNFQKSNPRGICAVCTEAKRLREHQEHMDGLRVNVSGDQRHVHVVLTEPRIRPRQPRSGRWTTPR